MTSTRSYENIDRFIVDLKALSEPMGEGAYALALSDLHERFPKLSPAHQVRVRQKLEKYPKRYRKVITFPLS